MSALITLAVVIMWSAIGGLFAGLMAYLWMECRHRDELDERYKREIRRAAHNAYTDAPRGRRDAA